MRERERERETEKKARTFGCAGLNRDPVRFQVGEKKKKKKREMRRVRATGDSRCRARD